MGDTEAEEVLARAYLATGNLPKAEDAARRALAAKRQSKRAILVLARVEALRGNLTKALALTNEVKALVAGKDEGALAGFHYLRGDLLARLDRPEEAEREFLEEVRRFPTRLEARNSLIALYAASGRREEAVAAVRDLLEGVPGPNAPLAAMKALRTLGEPKAAEEVRRQAAARFPSEPGFRHRTGR